MKESKLITVCAACLRASCWHGILYCDDYKTAGIMLKTRRELRRLKLESSHYWDIGMKALPA